MFMHRYQKHSNTTHHPTLRQNHLASIRLIGRYCLSTTKVYNKYQVVHEHKFEPDSHNFQDERRASTVHWDPHQVNCLLYCRPCLERTHSYFTALLWPSGLCAMGPATFSFRSITTLVILLTSRVVHDAQLRCPSIISPTRVSPIALSTRLL